MASKTLAKLIGLFLGGLLISVPAKATPFTVTAWAPAGGADVNIHNDNPLRNYNGSGGGFVMTNTSQGSVESFISWCVDIFQFIPGSTPGEYALDAGGGQLGLNGEKRSWPLGNYVPYERNWIGCRQPKQRGRLSIGCLGNPL